MPLSDVEKRAGRAFRDARQAVLDARNEQDPPGVFVLPLWRVVRHECPAAGGASTGVILREACEPSPEYWACYCGAVAPLSPEVFPHEDCDGGKVIAVAGQFAFIWKEGKCSGAGCGLAARTRRGRFVIAADRLPDHGRTLGERQARPHHRDPRIPRA
jgi:hypothetical protein